MRGQIKFLLFFLAIMLLFLLLVFPTVGPAAIDFIATEDIGVCLLTVFDYPEVFRSKTVGLVGDKLLGKMVVTILNEELSPMSFKHRQASIIQLR